MCDPDCSASSDVEEPGEKDASSILPERSRVRYECAYEHFEKWCEERNMKNEFNEKVLMAYFKNKAETQKPSSLWTYYSMLRSVISTKQNVDITQYKRLNAFLKKQSTGYRPKKLKSLTREDVSKFLTEAEDSKFLLMKVALIIGIGGGCRRDELANLLSDNVQDEGNFFRIVIPNQKTKAPQEFFITSGDIEGVNMVEVIRKYVALRPTQHIEHGRFFVGFKDGKCTKQPVGINAVGSVPKFVASFLKLPNPNEYTGHCFRRLSWEFKR